MESLPLLRFGVIADVQYADNDDKTAWYNPSKTRFYRNSLEQVKKAFKHWEVVSEKDESNRVSFILQLGDIIDALNTNNDSHSAIRLTLACFLNNPQMPTFHTIGNHELYNFSRVELFNLFDTFMFGQLDLKRSFHMVHSKSSSNDRINSLYYKFTPKKGIKFIHLDMYEISVLGYSSEHANYKLGSTILETHHGHTDFELWDTDHCLHGPNKRFQSSNGAVSEEQLDWLEHELHDSDGKHEIVFVFGHAGLHHNSCGWDSILWNYDQILNCFNRHSCVVAYFNGHAHNFGYAVDNGIHFISFHGVIETAPDVDAFATISIHSDTMIVDGRGVEPYLNLPLKHKYHEPSNEDDLSIVEPLYEVNSLHLVEVEVKV